MAQPYPPKGPNKTGQKPNFPQQQGQPLQNQPLQGQPQQGQPPQGQPPQGQPQQPYAQIGRKPPIGSGQNQPYQGRTAPFVQRSNIGAPQQEFQSQPFNPSGIIPQQGRAEFGYKPPMRPSAMTGVPQPTQFTQSYAYPIPPQQSSQQIPSTQQLPSQGQIRNLGQPENKIPIASQPHQLLQPQSQSSTVQPQLPSTQAQIPSQAQIPPQGQAFPGRKPPLTSGIQPLIGNVVNASTGQVLVQNQQTLTMPTTTGQASTQKSPYSSNVSNPIKPQVSQQQPVSQTQAAQSQPQSQTQAQSQPPVQSQSTQQPNKLPQVTGQQPSAPKTIASEKSSKVTGAPQPTEQKEKQSDSSNRLQASSGGRVKPWALFTGEKSDPKHCGWARVRTVHSGDTIELVSKPGDQSTKTQPVFLTVTLEGIRAPRVARKPDGEEDEFGFEAREFVKKSLFNKNIFFAVWRTITNKDTQRNFGDIYIQNGQDQNSRESLTKLVVENGWADVRPVTPAEQQTAAKAASSSKNAPTSAPVLSSTEITKLQQLNTQAQTKKVGKYQDSDPAKHTRALKLVTIGEDRLQLFEELKGKEVSAIVEQVRDGSTLRLEIIYPSNPMDHRLVLILLAGCSAPRIPIPHKILLKHWEENGKQGEEPKKQPTPPFANEAKEFVEARLLGQDVKLKMLTIDQHNNIYGTVSHPFGQISALLLKQGLANYTHWNASLCDKKEQELLKNASDEAKKNNRGIWEGRDPNQFGNDEHITATVSQIISGDTILVKLPDGEHRFTLSSIRCPRLGRETSDDEPLARDAKEFLRKKIIGKEVSLFKEYDRTSNSEAMKSRGLEKQVFATVYLGKDNLALSLVKNGFATVIKHRQDAPRSREYDQLVKAEQQAQKQKTGIHGSPTNEEILDLSMKTDKARTQQLQAEKVELYTYLIKKKRPAIVEFVFSGNRLKLFLPEKKRYIPLMLANIRCDPFTLGKQQNTDWGKAAYELLYDKLLQRNVTLEATSSSERNGMYAFLGNIYYNNKNIAEELVEKGLAEVMRVPVAKGQGRPEEFEADPKLVQLENKARETLQGFWKDVNREEEKKKEEKPQQTMAGKELKVVVSHIESTVSFYVNEAGKEKMEEMETKMSKIQKKNVNPKVNKLVAALYQGLYGRARVIKRDQKTEKSWHVSFIDYGNRAIVKQGDLSQLPFELSRIPPLANRCILACIRAPYEDPEFFSQAGQYFAELAMNKELRIKILGDQYDYRIWHVELFSGSDSINKLLAREGYVKLDKHFFYEIQNSEDEYVKNYIKEIREAIGQARSARKVVWQYGDVDLEDEQP